MAKIRLTRSKRRRIPRARRPETVTHHEFIALTATVEAMRVQIERNRIDLDIQFQRISQLQLDLDVTRKMVANRLAAEAEVEMIAAPTKITFES